MKWSQVLFCSVKNNIKPWRDAATLIIATQGSTANGVEYLVTQRSAKTKAFANRMCFPGGAMSEADSSLDWIDLFKRTGTDLTSLKFMASNARIPEIYNSETENNPISKEISLRITAIRETFEECGILLCKSDSVSNIFKDESELREWQNKVIKEPQLFIKMCSQLKVLPDLWSLIEWSNWHGPTMFSPSQRFNTIFYVTILKEPPEVFIDSTEVVECMILSARKLLEKFYSLGKEQDHRVNLAPPQAYELHRMKRISSLSDLEKLARLRMSLGLERWLPVPVTTKEGLLTVLPGDDLYPDKPHLYEHVVINKEDFTYDEISKQTRNHHRMKLYHWNRNPEIEVNIAQRFGQAYEI